MADIDVTGHIFNIQPYSVHDGPGIRTIVFFKGCPLRCLWCSNPESQNHNLEKGWNKTLCIGCGACARNCQHNALTFQENKLKRQHELCVDCGTCLQMCPAKAMLAYGEKRSVGSILDEIEEDSAFYERSGGGITLSGGEPLFQSEFALAMLREARARHINRAMETSGFAGNELFLKACGLLNYLLIDIKCMDPQQHLLFTGQDNKRILNNIRLARQHFPTLKIHIRTPVIPEFNDNEEEIKAIANFAKESGANYYNLLAYHKMGSAKYENLDRIYPLEEKKLDQHHFEYLEGVARCIMPGIA